MKKLGCALFLLLFAPVFASSADERILSYHSDIVIQTNNTLIVTETIKVRAEHKKIKRGIFRKYPTSYKDRLGGRMWVAFDVQRVTRNGEPSPYHIKKEGRYEVVYIGEENKRIKKGEHTYTITYITDRQIGFFEKHDELYYNITGNEWEFPIDKASAAISAPKTVPPHQLKLEAYTGPKGSKNQQAFEQDIRDRKAWFETTTPLKKNEGLTVVVSFPKGHIPEPTLQSKIGFLLLSDPCSRVAIIGATILLAYFFVVWVLVGRDPRSGTIIPQFFPPQGISPAGTRYLTRMGYDNRCFSAAIINLGVKGWIQLNEVPGRKSEPEFEIVKTNTEGGALSKGEQVVYKKLVGSRSKIRLVQTNHSSIGAAVSGLRAALKKEFDHTYFARNGWYLFPAVLIIFVTLGAVVLFSKDREAAGFMSLWLGGWTVAVIALAKGVASSFKLAKSGASAGTAVVSSLFALPFFAGELIGLGIFSMATSVVAGLTLICMAVIFTIFIHLMKAPTMHGRAVLDHLEGFRLYLTVAERDRLAMLQAPAKTPELFEAYLPYAVAMGVEQQWADQFTAVLAQAAASGQSGSSSSYSSWYHSSSSHGGYLAPAALAGAVGGALAAAAGASSTAPGSSSGGGGGGSSGGGGGGGGGGGW